MRGTWAAPHGRRVVPRSHHFRVMGPPAAIKKKKKACDVLARHLGRTNLQNELICNREERRTIPARPLLLLMMRGTRSKTILCSYTHRLNWCLSTNFCKSFLMEFFYNINLFIAHLNVIFVKPRGRIHDNKRPFHHTKYTRIRFKRHTSHIEMHSRMIRILFSLPKRHVFGLYEGTRGSVVKPRGDRKNKIGRSKAFCAVLVCSSHVCVSFALGESLKVQRPADSLNKPNY